MIVKVQISLYPPGSSMLVYPKSRTPLMEGPPIKEVLDLLKGDVKGYFEADYINGSWRIGARVADQNW